jgi:ADP-dependent NAD(P)H-hydrate dehydratase
MARTDAADRPELVTSEFLRDWRLPAPSGSKHSRGQVLVVGGSPSTPGAAMLAGIAALRVGAGVLGLAVARSVAGAVAAAVPEASVAGLPELDGERGDGVLAQRLPGCSVVLVGPGLDRPEDALDLVDRVVEAADDGAQFVLDAFALGVLNRAAGQAELAGRAVLTPNRAEAERLLDDGETADLDDEVATARAIARRYRAVVSYQRAIAEPGGRSWRVAAGHAGLGTSGSGDVLAGAVTGLLARGAEPAQAACWATFLHAVAGERLAARVGRLGFLARELAAELPVVLTETEA